MNGASPSNDVVLVVLNNSPGTQQIQVPLHANGRGEQPCWADGTLVKDELGKQIYTVKQNAITLELAPYQGVVITKNL